MRIPGARCFFSPESRARILKRIAGIMESGQLTMGTVVDELESNFAAYTGSRHAVAVSSGAAALYLTLQYYQLQGGEVIVPVETFVASANSIVLAGGVPRFVNIESNTLCLDLADVESSLNAKTKGVMVVHLAGQISPRIEELRMLCKQKGLFLIEDAAHAHGSTILGKKAGSLGDAGCFSFFATKVMTSGEGGIVTTDDEALAEFLRSVRNHGQQKGTALYETVSLNYRMSEITAAIAIDQLEHLEGFVARRNEVLALYRSKLADIDEIEFLPVFQEIRSACWKLYVRVAASIERDRLIQVMSEEYGVATQYAYSPMCHGQPALAHYVEDPVKFSPSEAIMARVICLPLFVGLTEEEVLYVTDSLKRALLQCQS